MPIDGKITPIGDQRDPEIDTHLQNKSFTRSVSVSESTTVHSSNDKSLAYRVPCGPSSIRPVPPTATAIRSVSGGDIDLLSPSPLSSFTATASSVSADSPYPPNASQDTTTPFDGEVSNIVATIMATTESSTSTGGGEPSPSSFEQCIPSVPQLKALFNDPNSRRTMNLLIHLLDDNLPSGWRDELVRSLSIIGSQHFNSRLDVPDDVLLSQQGVVSSVNLGTSIKVDESSDEASKLIDSKPPDHTPELVPVSKEARNALPNIFVSPGLIEHATKLAHVYELHYKERLGTLLEDILMSQSDRAFPSVGNSESEVTLESSMDDSPVDGIAPPDFLYKAHQNFCIVLNQIFEEDINWGRITAMLCFIRGSCAIAESKRIKFTSSDDQQSLSQEAHPAPTHSETTVNSDEAAVRGGETAVAPTQATNREDVGQRDDMDGCPRTATRQFSSGAAASSINGRRSVAGYSRPTPADYLFWATAYIHRHDGIWNWIADRGGWDGLFMLPTERDDVIECEIIRVTRQIFTGFLATAVGAVGLMAAMQFFNRRL